MEIELKKPWNLLTKMPALAGTKLVDFSEQPQLLTTYDEIRTYFTKNLNETE